MKKVYHNYYITGPDGSGKTSFIKEIKKHFHEKGVKTTYIWLRSPKIFSKPLMAYCRSVGLTKYKTINGIRYGVHEFYRSKIVSRIFPILQLLDFRFSWFFIKKKITKKECVLFDRFALDTLADLMVDTHRFGLHKTRLGKAFIKQIPENTLILVLSVKEEAIRARKKDTLYDENLVKLIEVFNILSRDLCIKIIDNNRGYNTVKNDIINYLVKNDGI